MNSKKLAGAGAATIGAATAVTALLLGSTTAVAQETRPDSAYGIAAAGALDIAPVPYVESIDGQPVDDELLGFGSPGELSAGVLTVQARGSAAESSVAKVNVPGVLRANLVRTYCEDAEGGLEIVSGSVLGRDLPAVPFPGQQIDLSPLLRLTLNDQVRHPDGSLTVTGIEVALLPSADRDLDSPLTGEERRTVPVVGDLLGVDLGDGAKTVRDVVEKLTDTLGAGLDLSGSVQTIVIGSATCSAYDDGPSKQDMDDGADDSPSADVPDVPDVPDAPKPEIVESDLPVTG